MNKIHPTFSISNDFLEGQIEKKEYKEWVSNEIENNPKKYHEKKEVKVVCATYNVNSGFPKTEIDLKYLRSGLQLDNVPSKGEKKGEDSENYTLGDIYAIGLQEVEMTAKSLLMTETGIKDQWTNVFTKLFLKVNEKLEKDQKYCVLCSRQSVGLYLIIVIKRKLLQHLNNVKLGIINCGALNGYFGNKGAIAVSLKLSNNSYCFMNCHLAPHPENLEKRNANYKMIESYLTFTETIDVIGGIGITGSKNLSIPNVSPSEGSKTIKSNEKLKVKDHDYIFWIGDFNYRVNLPLSDVLKLIRKENYQVLLKNDQLNLEKLKGNIFTDYKEGAITFKPTYKFVNKTDNYSVEKEITHVPSYTDRVLYFDHSLDQIKCKYYNSYNDLKISDHKLVVGVYSLFNNLLKIDMLRDNLLKYLDQKRQNSIPHLSVSPQELIFKDLEFSIPQENFIELKNTGNCNCDFNFVYFLEEPANRIEERQHNEIKNWIQVIPRKGTLSAGETIKISIVLNVTKFSSILNSKKRLDHCLILRLKNGRDFFVMVSANYIPSIYGDFVKNVVVKPKFLIPPKISMLIEYLKIYGMKRKFIFLKPGKKEEMELIRSIISKDPTIDTFKKEYRGSPLSVAEVLKFTIASFEDPIFPVFHNDFYSSLGLSSKFKSFDQLEGFLKDKLPTENLVLFNFIIQFLRELMTPENRIGNALSKATLSVIFAKVLFRNVKKDSGIMEFLMKLLS